MKTEKGKGEKSRSGKSENGVAHSVTSHLSLSGRKGKGPSPGGEFDCSVEKSVDFPVEFLSLIN